MARFSRIETAKTIENTGLVPLFYHSDIDIAYQVIKACYEGGVRVIEFTNRGDYAHEVFGTLTKYINKELPDLILGVGSVIDEGTAALYLQLGANFIVSPMFKEDVALTCNRRKILYSPGCATLTEISKAEEYGVEIVKIFPGDTVGPSFVKSVKAPCPWTSMMVTGGVTAEKENLTQWFESGVTAVGMGSKLIGKEVIENKDFTGLTKKVKSILSIIKRVRKS